jgi:hypothetical protein
MKKILIPFILLFLVASTAFLVPIVTADSSTLSQTDFQQPSFAKTVDYFNYARAYAALSGVSTPANFDQWHANMYMTYVNTSGIQLLYAGLENITTDGSSYLRLPAQSILMHYKTGDGKSDVLTASTFLMLMAFNDSSSSRFQNSPDVGDNLYASYSLGYDLSSLGVTLPSLNSQTITTPLTSSADGLTWTWGMKYTNLTAFWWRTWIDPSAPHFDNSLPFAVTTYDDLAFNYKLTIDPTSHTATLTENHDIGRMRDLVIGSGLVWVHMNSTGTYGLLGRKLSDQTIYNFLDENQIKMSIVDYQTTVMADHNTYSATPSGQNVTGTDAIVSDTTVNTYMDNGEKISSLDFAAKPTYNLFNYTADQTETTPTTYNAVTRTANATGFAGNTDLFKAQTNLMKFLPLVVAHIYPGIYAKAAESISNMSKADYFYLTSYPVYSGYRIEHDPIFTAYIASPQTTPSPAPTATPTTNSTPRLGIGGIIVILLGLIIVVVVAFALLIKRRMPKP